MPENLRGLPADRPDDFRHAGGHQVPLTEAATNIERVRIERLSVRAKPLGPVLRQLAQRLGLELKLDEQAIGRAGISLEQRSRCWSRTPASTSCCASCSSPPD